MRFNKKRLAVAAALATSALLLSACSSGDGAEEAAGDGAGNNADTPAWCGPDEATLTFLDGFGGNGWRMIAAETGRMEAGTCPSITDFEFIDGQGDTQKAISDINGAVATGADAIVVHTASGEAILPALRSAFEAGIVTVPYRDSPGGEAGTDYDEYVAADYVEDGRTWARWIEEQFPDGAKILFLSGPAGTSQGIAEHEGLTEVLSDEKYEFIGEQPFEITEWDPAKTQQVLTAAIAKHPQIDVIVSDFGPSLVGALPEFEKNGRSIPALAASDGNVLGCFWEDHQETSPDFKMMTIKTGTDNIRLAVQHAVARATGGEIPAETLYVGGVFEDSTSEDKPVQCERDLPDDIYLSSALSGEEQAALIGG
ncbi:substrate-binding domain-containing protein [Leucobacter weissii]|uniref:Substrate-binding domain-containing protein n=1 Tax=Leucobacter weissii TaxID=1983706 RepID=A0A939MJ47_9MICO|nr:substrate-binding domain-containing protein [Leucobacter weissii]MBO1901516.1 substrate-binding domain-containing protein [Leucobacter weissii]